MTALTRRVARTTTVATTLAVAPLALLSCRDAASRRDGAAAAVSAEARAACDSTTTGDAARAATAPRIATIPVNRGTHGMSAHVRWALSPDRCALLVVEDPVSIEADPVPNGFVLATERGGGVVVQRASVWDVAPSPDWTRLAYARASWLQAGDRDTLTAAEWAELGRRAGVDAAVARRDAFPASGMATAYALGRAVILDIAAAGDTTGRLLPTAAAWRVRWTRDGSAVVIGSRPLRTADAAPATQWDLVDAGTPAARSASERAQSLGGDVTRAELAWTEGPDFDVGAAHGLDSSATIAVDGGTVETRGGTIWLRTRGPTATVIAVGPGVALAATRGGRFVAALSPAAAPAEHEPKVRLVVYRVDW